MLLNILSALRTTQSFELFAVHVHHGLSPNADSWADFCTSICNRLSVPLHIERVMIDKSSGLGIEASARQARYQALYQARDALNADYIALAHHQDDQAETMLLQLVRGAGVKGLAAMAQVDEKRSLYRPLLNIPRALLLGYAKERQLQWIEDESNQDQRYDRNFYRHEVLSKISQRSPAAISNMARAAEHMAEASKLLDELAAQDVGANSQLYDASGLSLQILLSLSAPRARNVLRWWLAQHHQPMPSTARLHEMYQQLISAKADATIKVTLDSAKGTYLRRYRGVAYVQQNEAITPIELTWQGEPELSLPDGSYLKFEQVTGQGLALQRLAIDKLRIKSRHGGERFKPHAARPTRTLKHLLQEANIPPWQRERMPLIYANDILAVVPMVGVAYDMQATAGELGLVISWVN